MAWKILRRAESGKEEFIHSIVGKKANIFGLLERETDRRNDELFANTNAISH